MKDYIAQKKIFNRPVRTMDSEIGELLGESDIIVN